MPHRFFAVSIVGLCAVAVGCDGPAARRPPERPIVAGTLARDVTLWKMPVGAQSSNTGNPAPKGSRVEVYDRFILITPADGKTILSPHGWYTDLEFRRDP